MNDMQLEILKNELGLELSPSICEKLEAHQKLFLEYSSHTNLMSKGDLALLFEKHIFDSLAIFKYKGFARAAGGETAGGALVAPVGISPQGLDCPTSPSNGSACGSTHGSAFKILDVGTGGGFPGLILAICFENIEVIAVDSIAKKINFIDLAARELGLKNIKPIRARTEELPPQNADIITSRAVGSMLEIYKNSCQHLKQAGEFIFWKASPEVYRAEIKELQAFLKRKIDPKTIAYNLPTPEAHKRTLIVCTHY